MVEHRPTMAAKGQVLATINSFLKEDFDKIHVFVIQAILHLALMEVSRNHPLLKSCLIECCSSGILTMWPAYGPI
jgi:hypothetical protein